MNMIPTEKSVSKLALYAAVIVAAVIAFLSLQPAGDVPPLNFNDKFLHFVAYAVFSFLAVLGRHNLRILSIVVLVGAYGILMEILQGVLPFNRSASGLDIVANMFGVAGGTLFAQIIAWVLTMRDVSLRD